MAIVRSADSDCILIKLSKLSTSNKALAVSLTRQTTIAPISIGLPLASLTLSCLVSKFRKRMLTFFFLKKGTVQRNPLFLTVPI